MPKIHIHRHGTGPTAIALPGQVVNCQPAHQHQITVETARVGKIVNRVAPLSPGDSKCTTSGRFKVHHFGRGVFLAEVG